MKRMYDPYRDVIVLGDYPKDGGRLREEYYMPHPAHFLNDNNGPEGLTWDTKDTLYRPGKMREFQQNIADSTDLVKLDSVFSAKRLNMEHQGATFNVVGASPSLNDTMRRYREVESNNINDKFIGLNRATFIMQRLSYIPWTERMADATVFIRPNEFTKIITAPFCSPTALRFALSHEVYCYNMGSFGGLGDLTRTWWNLHKKTPLLECPSVHDSFMLALAMAYWMGAAKVRIFGVDYCWFNHTEYYYNGGTCPDPELIYERHISSGLEGAEDHDKLIWQHSPVQIKDKSGSKVWTTPDLMSRAYKANAILCAYRHAGMEVEVVSDRGFITGKGYHE